ncbi:Aste57867_16071 [Aphanomyces stellatus]|uniref:Aste57867_16071 protein n=1 Tax=Aphanomyces stellatus TaxID=120398 RepID=A0A485L5L2_9STRA|nr:hypothetical protein As57867_016015 [Aphanomyces stellatus]VFT92855.1 Aste57867_16071 [Aphanomyces stellatus]
MDTSRHLAIWDADDVNALHSVEGFKWKYTPLALACARGKAEIVQSLLARDDIQVNCPTDFGATPLTLAAQAGDVAITKHLLAHPSIDVNARDNKGNSALIHAAAKGNVPIVTALLSVPAVDVNHRNLNYHTTLLLAAVNCNGADCCQVENQIHPASGWTEGSLARMTKHPSNDLCASLVADPSPW